MFDFVRKPQIWRAMDAEYLHEIHGKMGFPLKKIQDLAIYAQLRRLSELDTDFWLNRFSMYRRALTDRADLEPIGEIVAGAHEFETDRASNPDSVVHDWRALSPSLGALRQVAQSVSLQWGARKRGSAGGAMMGTGAMVNHGKQASH